MYFRNLTLFRMPPELVAAALMDAEACVLQSRFNDHELRDCGPIELATRGFVSPISRDSDVFAHQCGTCYLFAVGEQTKILPAVVLNEFLAKAISEILEQDDRRVGGRERKRIKEDLLTQLLPRAFIRPSRVLGYFDLTSDWLVIDTSSQKAAEEVVSQIREALGPFPAMPPSPQFSPRTFMTDWLIAGKLPEGFTWGDECELRDPAEAGAVVRFSKQDLDSDEVREHLKTGMQAYKLGLEFEGRAAFVLDESLVIRKFRLLDVVTDSIDQGAIESTVDELDARFALMSLEVRRLLARLAEIFGIGAEPSCRLDAPPTPKSMRAAAVNERMDRMDTDHKVVAALGKLAPKRGSGIDSITISVPGSNIPPVTLTPEDSERLRSIGKQIKAATKH